MTCSIFPHNRILKLNSACIVRVQMSISANIGGQFDNTIVWISPGLNVMIFVDGYCSVNSLRLCDVTPGGPHDIISIAIMTNLMGIPRRYITGAYARATPRNQSVRIKIGVSRYKQIYKCCVKARGGCEYAMDDINSLIQRLVLDKLY